MLSKQINIYGILMIHETMLFGTIKEQKADEHLSEILKIYHKRICFIFARNFQKNAFSLKFFKLRNTSWFFWQIKNNIIVIFVFFYFKILYRFFKRNKINKINCWQSTFILEKGISIYFFKGETCNFLRAVYSWNIFH